MSVSGQRIVVIGGGIIGTACAYYLSRAGGDVAMIDRNRPGEGCSFGNCGLICPSHLLPLAEPGVVFKTLKAMFRSNSPFYIQPRWDLALWSWLLRFARRCNGRDMLEAAHARHALLQSSMALYRQMLAEEHLDCDWQDRGLLFVYRSRSEMDAYARTDELLRDRFDEGAIRYDGDAVVELEPALRPGLAGGWHFPADAHLRPDKLMAGWHGVLAKRGVRIHLGCEFRGFAREDSLARAIATSQGEMAADTFVVATGALTPLWNQHLGCRVPIQPGKGYSITMPRPARCPVIPLIFPEHKVAVTPMLSAYRLGSTMEFSGYDTSINRRRLALLKEGASHYLHEPYCDPVEQEWYGWRPMSCDDKPIIDRSPQMSNVWLATGHSMVGISMAPATGKLVAELVTGATPHVDPQPFAVTRFGRR